MLTPGWSLTVSHMTKIRIYVGVDSLDDALYATQHTGTLTAAVLLTVSFES